MKATVIGAVIITLFMILMAQKAQAANESTSKSNASTAITSEFSLEAGREKLKNLPPKQRQDFLSHAKTKWQSLPVSEKAAFKSKIKTHLSSASKKRLQWCAQNPEKCKALREQLCQSDPNLCENGIVKQDFKEPLSERLYAMELLDTERK